MSLINKFNRWFSKKRNLELVQVITAIITFLYISGFYQIPSRAGLFGLFGITSGLAIGLIIIGIILIIIPEPATTITGIIMTLVGVIIIWGASAIEELVSNHSGAVIIGIVGFAILFLITRRRSY